MPDIVIQSVDTITPAPSNEKLQTWAKVALEGCEHEVTLRLVDASEIQALNRDYRQKDKPTNVLSFPFEVPEGLPCETLGDVILCTAIILEEAQEQHKSYDAHFAHMVIHGILHLRGFDHIDEQDAVTMEQKEITLLHTLGFNNPYGDTTI